MYRPGGTMAGDNRFASTRPECVDLRDGSVDGRRHALWPAESGALCLDNRHGRRLRREADRCLSGQCAQLARRHNRVQGGGLSATGAGRAVPRPLPPRSDASTGIRTEQGGLVACRDAGHRIDTFRAGHRIMVQIQSSWFPTFDRNPQTFVDNIFFARPEDYKVATMRCITPPASSHASHPGAGGCSGAAVRSRRVAAADGKRHRRPYRPECLVLSRLLAIRSRRGSHRCSNQVVHRRRRSYRPYYWRRGSPRLTACLLQSCLDRKG